ncbi:MAG: M23 family metallopeptidase [Bacteroidota bacterium]
MYGKRIILDILLCLLALASVSFHPPVEEYAYPIESFYSIAGTFGELRSNHFHAGIDIKTNNRIGIPIRAVTDGYVYRLNDMPGGYGRAIYLKHSDGNFSVYGHLSRFIDTLETIMYEAQVEDEQAMQNLYLPKKLVPVTKGQVIGYSGNSGSSYGPHLHFEIRDKDERILNPFVYFKGYFKDKTRPRVQKIAFLPLDKESSIKGKCERWETTLTRSGVKYRIPGVIPIRGKVGLAYQAHDLLDSAPNKCGINYAQLFLDDSLLFAFRLDTFGFDETRNINVHLDYAHFKKTKARFQKAFVSNGNILSAYQTTGDKGVLVLQDSLVHNIRIVLQDFHGNESVVVGKVQRAASTSPLGKRNYGSRSPDIVYEIKGDMLHVKVKYPSSSMQEALEGQYQSGKHFAISPAYVDRNDWVYVMLLDRFDYPAFVEDTVSNMRWDFDPIERIFPQQNNLIQKENVKIYFPYQSVFEPLHLRIRTDSVSERLLGVEFEIGNEQIPLRESYMIGGEVKASTQTDHWVLARWSKNKWSAVRPMRRTGNYVYARTRSFGRFSVMKDTIPPLVRPSNFVNGGTFSAADQEMILFVGDRFSDIVSSSISGRIGEQWVPFKYDYKRDRIIYNWRGRRPKAGKHILQIRVKDGAGNITEKQFTVNF